MSARIERKDSFLLKGTQVNFNQRDHQKERKNSNNSIMSSRPLSATSASHACKKEKNVAFKLKRPLSADTIYCNDKSFTESQFANMDSNDYCDTRPSKDCTREIADLPSTQILKSLLSDSLSRPWENNNLNQSNNYKTSSNDSTADSEKSLGAKIKEFAQRSITDSGMLIPGVKTKPPLPEKPKKKYENSLHLNLFAQEDNFEEEYKLEDNDACFLEDIEDTENSISNENLSNTSFRNWLQENNNLLLETKLLETQTDLELQNVHKHQDELNESIINIDSLFNNKDTTVLEEPKKNSARQNFKSSKPGETITSTTNNKPNKLKASKPLLYRTEFHQNKSTKTNVKTQKDACKKPPKSILKPCLNPKKPPSPQTTTKHSQLSKQTQKEDEDHLEDNVNSWMSSNSKHESFLAFLNKLDDLETPVNEETSSRTLSQRSYLQDAPVHDQENNVSSTCDEIASILEVLEKEDLKSQKTIESYKEILNNELSPESTTSKQNGVSNIESRCSSTSSLDSSSDYNEFLSYLDEVDKTCVKTLQTAKDRIKTVSKVTNAVLSVDTVPKLEDLLNYSTVELSHYVVDISLRLKEKSSGISTLQTEISKLRALITSKSEEFDRTLKQKLKIQKDEYEPVIKRHQKFIDQLIADKKVLNQQCEGLINEMKVLEDRYNTNMRAVDQRHKVELQKAKEMHMAAEKLRREKWIEGKTQKIKEMTVKGLEPELQNMTTRHQQELSDLRSLHKRELEELELRGARKTQQQCEALRQQLTLEREQAIAHEREILRQRLEKLVESEEKSYQELRRRLSSEHASRLAECEDRIAVVTNEKERAIEAAKCEFEDKFQTALRRHKTELKNTRESSDLEFEVWKNNYKKQQNIKMAEVEAQLRNVCKKERDKEIEMVIERLEKEADETKMQMEQAADNRLRRMKEKYEEEIKDLEATTTDYKSKYSETKEKLLSSEDNLLNLKTSMKQLQSQLQQAKQISDELSMDKNKFREQLKEEFVGEIKVLEDEIKVLKNSREDEMQKIFAKVKLTVTHKDELLSELSKNNSNLQEKCTLLENLLEQQRKDYLIK